MTPLAPVEDAAVLLQRASVWQQDGDLPKAEEAYRRVLALDPANPDALNLLALIHHEKGDRELAIRMLRAAIKIRPEARFYTNLGVVLAAHGDRTGSIAAYRLSVQANPAGITAWPGVIFAMDLHPHSLPEVRLADRRAFNARHCAALTAQAPPHENDPDPDRRLRVGYISADFTLHSAANVFEPVLRDHDHEAVEVTCYWQQEGEPDEVTERIEGYADKWRVVNDFPDEVLAEMIRGDKIDILIDLSGYSNGNRLLALARKPAPIIMTAWGHVTGLGIDACDYILADEVTVPPEHEGYYHERILRLPCILAYAPPEKYPEVAPPPKERNGYTTFGYLGRANKTSEAVWATWAKILHRVPHSRLILKGNDYVDETFRARLTDFFVSVRISSHRLEFRGPSQRFHHLEAHHDVDICLDPFPQGGGVTILEACLMGVPSVVLLGNYMNGRIAASVLSAVGKPSWVSDTMEDYVRRAAIMAQRDWTLEDRLSLRRALLGSILCRPREYAASVERTYRETWKTWVVSQRGATSSEAAG